MKSMRFTRRTRRLVLTLHVVTSVAYVGVMALVAWLAFQAARAPDPDVAMGMYRSARTVLPVVHATALSALASGILISLGTVWGLVRHWWVVAKLALTILLAVTGFVVVRRALGEALALQEPMAGLVGSSTAHVVVAVTATVLSIYKPWGRVGRRTDEVVARQPAGVAGG